jgi:hypothetical protein
VRYLLILVLMAFDMSDRTTTSLGREAKTKGTRSEVRREARGRKTEREGGEKAHQL